MDCLDILDTQVGTSHKPQHHRQETAKKATVEPDKVRLVVVVTLNLQ